MKHKDNWRFYYIGDKDWIVENFYSYNPEDDIIEALDNEDTEQVSFALRTSEEDNKPNVHHFIDQLPERYSSILWDYYFEGKTLKQIGKERGYSKQYAYQEMKIAKQLLRKAMTK